MAIAELSRVLSATTSEDELRGDVDVRVEVHDASRLEWAVTVPLPEKRAIAYRIDVEIDIPANVFARHASWDHLQSWTRLDGPAELAAGHAVTIDTLRRVAIAYAHKLARAHDGFSRHCRLAGSLSAHAPLEGLVDGLNLWIGVAAHTIDEARERLTPCAEGDCEELVRERDLADEYLSVRLLEMLAGAERALTQLAASRHAAAYADAVVAAENAVAEALSIEIAHRQERGHLCADPASTSTLEQYLDRGSRLKKHFQEVLFLEPETFQVAERLHHWVAALVALMASFWAFAWQLALTRTQSSPGTRIGSGLVMFALVAGVVYATKDRMKEAGRLWISGNVHRFYAQRVARWRAPARRLASRDVVVKARESFAQSVQKRPDPLNPSLGATASATVMRYVHSGQVSACAPLVASGIRRVKHIFRYDLSPIFARLDDAVKQVPVLDGETHRVRFIDAPRCYRVPVRLRVECGDLVREKRGVLVLHKRGLDRLEMD